MEMRDQALQFLWEDHLGRANNKHKVLEVWAWLVCLSNRQGISILEWSEQRKNQNNWGSEYMTLKATLIAVDSTHIEMGDNVEKKSDIIWVHLIG